MRVKVQENAKWTQLFAKSGLVKSTQISRFQDDAKCKIYFTNLWPIFKKKHWVRQRQNVLNCGGGRGPKEVWNFHEMFTHIFCKPPILLKLWLGIHVLRVFNLTLTYYVI